MAQQDFSNLTGKILIASPFAMSGNVFYKSLIYIIKHTEEGSVGLMFNHTIHNAPSKTLFKKIDVNIDSLKLDIHLGGPIEIARGFFLHTTDYNKDPLFNSEDNKITVSSNPEILQDIVDGTGPENSLFIIGYTGWEAGQLEFELENNLWLVSEPDHDLIFHTDSEKKWDKAIEKLGISPNDFVEQNMATC